MRLFLSLNELVYNFLIFIWQLSVDISAKIWSPQIKI